MSPATSMNVTYLLAAEDDALRGKARREQRRGVVMPEEGRRPPRSRGWCSGLPEAADSAAAYMKNLREVHPPAMPGVM